MKYEQLEITKKQFYIIVMMEKLTWENFTNNLKLLKLNEYKTCTRIDRLIVNKQDLKIGTIL